MEVVMQITFIGLVVVPLATYLAARMITYGILMSRKRFQERHPNNLKGE